jgi:hypothetical protein
LGALATSPKVIKAAINSGRIPWETVKSITGFVGKKTPQAVDKAVEILNNRKSQLTLEGVGRGVKSYETEKK